MGGALPSPLLRWHFSQPLLSAPLAPGGRGRLSTPAVDCLSLLSWQQEYKDLPRLFSSCEATIFALKVTNLGATRMTTPWVEQAPKDQEQVPKDQVAGPSAKRKLSCHLRP